MTIGAPHGAHATLADGTRLRVRGGADAEELAALVVALDAAARVERRPVVPAWQRAALLDGVGAGPVSTRAALATTPLRWA